METEFVLITVCIDAMERRDIDVVDAPCAFLSGGMDEEVMLNSLTMFRIALDYCGSSSH